MYVCVCVLFIFYYITQYRRPRVRHNQQMDNRRFRQIHNTIFIHTKLSSLESTTVNVRRLRTNRVVCPLGYIHNYDRIEICMDFIPMIKLCVCMVFLHLFMSLYGFWVKDSFRVIFVKNMIY